MKQELQEALGREFPFLRREPTGELRSIHDAYGMDIEDGWFALVRNLCAEITAAFAEEGLEPDLVIDQIKQKYGELRFYYHHFASESVSPELQRKIMQIVDGHEEKSGDICEVCGGPGSVRKDSNGYCLALCDEHFRMHEEKIAQINRQSRKEKQW